MTHQPKTSLTGELSHGRGAAETAADSARFSRGQSWDSFLETLPRNVQPWPDEEASPRQPALKKDNRSKDDDC